MSVKDELNEYEKSIKFWEKVKHKFLKIGNGGFEYISLGDNIRLYPDAIKDLKAIKDFYQTHSQ